MDKFRPSLNELLLSELWPLLPSDFILFTIDKNELKLMTDGRVDCSGYLSGTFLIVYNNEAPNLSHSIKLTQRILSAVPDWHAIHFLYEDHIAQGTGIPIANFIDGPRYDEDTLPIA